MSEGSTNPSGRPASEAMTEDQFTMLVTMCRDTCLGYEEVISEVHDALLNKRDQVTKVPFPFPKTFAVLTYTRL